MKTLKLFIPAFISLTLCLVLAFIFVSEQKKQKNDVDVQVHEYNMEVDQTDNDELLPYNDYIYFKNITELYILKNNDKITLKESLKNSTFINTFMEYFKIESEYANGTIYKNKDNNVKQADLYLIKCNNGSYIIGNNNLKYTETICE